MLLAGWQLQLPPSVYYYFLFKKFYLGFPGDLDGKVSTCHAGDLDSIPGLRRSLEEGMATHSSILAWRIPMEKRSLAGYSPRGHKLINF